MTERAARPLRILIAEDSEDDVLLVRRTLEKAGYAPGLTRCDTPGDFTSHLRNGDWDLVLSDWTMPGFGGLAALQLLQDSGLDLPFILVSGTVDEETAVAAMRAGAQDFVSKQRMRRLVPAVERELRDAEIRRQHARVLATLRETESTLVSFYENAPIMMGVVELTDDDILHIYDNPAVAAFFGHAPGLSNGRLASEVGAPREAVDMWRRHYREAEENAASVHFEYSHPGADGPLWLACTVAVIGPGSSGRTRFCYIAENATKRHVLEEERDRALQQLSSVVDTSPLAIVVVDRDLRVRLWNRAAARMLGWAAEEVVGKHYAVQAVEDGDESRHIFSATFKGDTAIGMAVRRRHRDGAQLELRLWSAQIADASGEVYAVLGIFADVSEQMRVEERLRQSAKLEAIGRLAGGIAHDFNNVLTSIIGHTEFLAAELPPDSPLQDDVATIRHGATHATALTRQLLAFSRRDTPSPRVLDVGTVMRQTEQMLRPLIGAQIQLELDIQEGLWTVHADPVQIEQVLMNLALNARDAMPRGGRLLLSAKNTIDTAAALPAGGELLRISVIDEGEGMLPEVQEHLFEPFFSTKPAARGTGLGLATVYGIVQQLGGTIEVQSEVGRGTTFHIYLPRVDAAPDSATDKAGNARAAAPGKGIILVVEDEEAIRKLVRRVLERAGYRVLEARNGIEALILVEREHDPLDLLLTDAIMPMMGGHELVAQVRRLRPGTACLLMSGHADRGESDGAVLPFIQKPFLPDELLVRIGEICSAGLPSTSA